MDRFLMIENPGVADPRSITLIGLSTTRFDPRPGTIGCFGTGLKFAFAALLREGDEPVVCPDLLKMHFTRKPDKVGETEFGQIQVKYSGKDLDGKSKTSTELLSITDGFGQVDWKKPHTMALREFVSNAIDGAIKSGAGYKSVRIEVVDKVRAKKGHTRVFLPYSPGMENAHKRLGLMFLHIGQPKSLEQKLLPKRFPDNDEVLVYKKGVLVTYFKGKSVYDYNLGDELELDEARNSNEWQVKQAIGRVLKNATAEQLAPVIKAVLEDPTTFEGKLDSYALRQDTYDNEETKERRRDNFQKAWKAVAGDKGVVTQTATLHGFIKNKGMTPVQVAAENWVAALSSYDIPTEVKVLTHDEREGKVTGDASADMKASLDKVWNLLTSFGMTNDKAKPNVRSFHSIMEGGAQTWGYYVQGGNDIFVHRDLTAGPFLDKVVLEEVGHYVTQATDASRDFQDWLLRVITAIAF